MTQFKDESALVNFSYYSLIYDVVGKEIKELTHQFSSILIAGRDNVIMPQNQRLYANRLNSSRIHQQPSWTAYISVDENSFTLPCIICHLPRRFLNANRSFAKSASSALFSS